MLFTAFATDDESTNETYEMEDSQRETSREQNVENEGIGENERKKRVAQIGSHDQRGSTNGVSGTKNSAGGIGTGETSETGADEIETAEIRTGENEGVGEVANVENGNNSTNSENGGNFDNVPKPENHENTEIRENDKGGETEHPKNDANEQSEESPERARIPRRKSNAKKPSTLRKFSIAVWEELMMEDDDNERTPNGGSEWVRSRGSERKKSESEGTKDDISQWVKLSKRFVGCVFFSPFVLSYRLFFPYLFPLCLLKFFFFL